MKSFLPGLFLCLAVAVPSWFLGRLAPVIGGAVISVVIGMFAANIFSINEKFTAGIKFSSKRVLQTAVVLLGFNMNLRIVAQQGVQAFLLIAAVILIAFITAFTAGKLLKMASNEKILIGVGTAICGGSAIAAVSPAINASDEEIAKGISTIFLYNIAAIFLFPLFGRLLNMDSAAFGTWAGLAVNDTSSVLTAAYNYSDISGDTATIVKLTRTLFIIPVTIILAARTGRRHRHPANFLPMFIVFFILTCVINTINILPANLTTFLGTASRFCITLVMAAIGLSTNIKKLIKSGRKPLLLGLCCWVSVAAASFLLINIFNTGGTT